MRRAGIGALLAVAVVLAGCPSDGRERGTLTPAPVPTVETETRTAELPADCAVPTPPAPPATGPELPDGPAAIPVENGSVDGAALVERHERVLADHWYRLAVPGIDVRVAPNRSALLATAGSDDAGFSHYAIDGRQYTVYLDGGDRRYEVAPFDGEPAVPGYGGTLSVTGRGTIRQLFALADHRVERVRSDNWTVLRAEVDEPTSADGPRVVDGLEVYELNSTMLVDRRGIVRSVEARVVYRPRAGGEGSRLTSLPRLSISGIDETRFERPSWVCAAAESERATP